MNRIFTLSTDNNQIKVDYNYSPGHIFGQGQVSPDYKFNFVHIPKNASTAVRQVLYTWKYSNYHNMDFSPAHLVILRDPVERWISGVSEFLIGNFSHMGNCNIDTSIEEITALMDSQMFQNLLFEFVIFDAHTIPQCCFIEGLDISRITFFYHDDLVIPRLLNYVGLDTNDIKNVNESLTNPKKIVILNKVKNLLEENSNLRHSIDKHYYADHVLFDKVKFHY